LDRHNFTFIHPVHAVFPFADLSHESISMGRFLELLERLEMEDRYLMIDDVAMLVGLKQCKRLDELDKQLRRFRRFKEACLELEVDRTILLRGIIQHIINYHFQTAWPDISATLVKSSFSEQSPLLSCKTRPRTQHSKAMEYARGRNLESHPIAWVVYSVLRASGWTTDWLLLIANLVGTNMNAINP